MKERSLSTSKLESAVLPPAGYIPETLDPTLRTYLGACERAVTLAESLGPRVKATLDRVASAPEEPAFEEAEMLTILYDRLSKAGLNLVKAVDELSRLRSFLAGGPDSRPDLSSRGEQELRTLLLETCEKLGFDLVARSGPVA